MRTRSAPELEPAEVTPFTLLVIDPDDRVRVLLRCMLEPHICLVVGAADGATGLGMVESHPTPIDGVITEVRMAAGGGIDGTEVIAALAECCPRLPVLAMSCDAAARSGLPAGVDFVTKPFEPRDVIASVINLLVKGRAARAGGRARPATAAGGPNGATIQREKLNLIAAVLALRERRPAAQI